MSDHEILRQLLAGQQHAHTLLHAVLDGQAEIIDAISQFSADENDAAKLIAIRDRIAKKTEALKAALAAAPSPPT